MKAVLNHGRLDAIFAARRSGCYRPRHDIDKVAFLCDLVYGPDGTGIGGAFDLPDGVELGLVCRHGALTPLVLTLRPIDDRGPTLVALVLTLDGLGLKIGEQPVSALRSAAETIEYVINDVLLPGYQNHSAVHRPSGRW